MITVMMAVIMMVMVIVMMLMMLMVIVLIVIPQCAPSSETWYSGVRPPDLRSHEHTVPRIARHDVTHHNLMMRVEKV